ncbi:hypothetical protein F4777DRAFT_288352 [Nemania sp. FL0916]|nr:hypothetical protein F4777DRAFT_288352 [Nemania sp. FL0916]
MSSPTLSAARDGRQRQGSSPVCPSVRSTECSVASMQKNYQPCAFQYIKADGYTRSLPRRDLSCSTYHTRKRSYFYSIVSLRGDHFLFLSSFLTSLFSSLPFESVSFLTSILLLYFWERVISIWVFAIFLIGI